MSKITPYDLVHLNIIYLEHKESMISTLEEYVKNEEVDLFVRWCYFMKYSEVFPLANYSRHRETNFHNLYDMERHQVYEYRDYLEDSWLDLDSQEALDEELVKNIREEFESLDKSSVNFILNSSECGFTYDW